QERLARDERGHQPGAHGSEELCVVDDAAEELAFGPAVGARPPPGAEGSGQDVILDADLGLEDHTEPLLPEHAVTGVAPSEEREVEQPTIGVEVQRDPVDESPQRHGRLRIPVGALGPRHMSAPTEPGSEHQQLGGMTTCRAAPHVFVRSPHHREDPEETPVELAALGPEQVVASDGHGEPPRPSGPEKSCRADHLLGRERLPATQLDLTMHPQHRAAVGRGADRHHPVQPTGARPRGDRPHLQGITGGGPDLGPQSSGSGRQETGCAGGHRRLPYTRAPMRASTDRMRPAGAAETTGAMTTIDTTAAIAMGQIRTWPRITRNPPYAKSTATVAHRRAKSTASAVPGSGQASA